MQAIYDKSDTDLFDLTVDLLLNKFESFKFKVNLKSPLIPLIIELDLVW